MTEMLTTTDLEAALADDRHQGWGYATGRDTASSEGVATADAFVLEQANAHGWNAEALFAWVNSRPARWYADIAYHEPRSSWPSWVANQIVVDCPACGDALEGPAPAGQPGDDSWYCEGCGVPWALDLSKEVL